MAEKYKGDQRDSEVRNAENQPALFANFPQELTENLKGDWSIPARTEGSPDDEYREHRFLMSKIENYLGEGEEDEAIKAEAGRILHFFKDSIGEIADPNTREQLQRKADSAWAYYGKEANDRYIEIRDARRKQESAANPTFFAELPSELTDSLKGDWSIPAPAEGTPNNPNREITWLLARLEQHLSITEEDESVRAEAGRILSYVRNSDLLNSVTTPGLKEQYTRRIQQAWNTGGSEANDRYKEKLAQRNGDEEQQPTEEIEDNIKYPELSQEFTESRSEANEAIGELWEQLAAVKRHSSHLGEFCHKNVETISKQVEAIATTSPDSKLIAGLQLITKMLEKVPANHKTITLQEKVQSAPERPELPELDQNHLNALKPEDARGYVDGMKDKCKGAVETYSRATADIIKSAKNAMGQITHIGGSLHSIARGAEANVAQIAERIQNDYDQTIAAVFQIRHVPINPGQPLDYEKMDIGTAVYTDDANKHETVESVIREGYLFDPKLSSGDRERGDVLQQPSVAVYSTKVSPE